ncbi:MAG TPA: sigma-70 family RNA polymerase sigma factor [Myxococcaceae bacterium]|nr:sigma-70 family RNA polymerase sigma factor [Myxococcaceae bacterium]
MTDTTVQDDDRTLLVRAQGGDMSAFEELVGRHEEKVYGLALRMTRSEADAAEITQDTFLSAYQHLGEFRGEAAFGSWVHRIAANNALMRLRRQKVLDIVSDEIAGPEFTDRGSLAEVPESDWSRRADDKILDDELRRAIQEATDALPEGYREVFLLKDVEGLSYEEISEMVGISIPAVKSRLHRARLALREAIDAFYKEV